MAGGSIDANSAMRASSMASPSVGKGRALAGQPAEVEPPDLMRRPCFCLSSTPLAAGRFSDADCGVQCTATAKPGGRAKYSRVSWMTTGLSRISESRFGNAMSAFSVSATSQTKFSWATDPTNTTAVQIQR